MRDVVSFEQFYESIWLKIPEVWRNADVEQGRPLQLLTLTLAQHFYYSFYLKIAAMDELFDIDACPDKYLTFLASILNWKLLGNDPASWRNQLKHAPLLYKIKGTKRAITIAEKLVGYSVFITELYRDYTGKIVPKEKVFNNFPVSVKIKPWFRKTATDISKDIFNDSFSDILPAFNDGSGDISPLGDLIVPKKLKRTSSRTMATSTLANYNTLTGANSLARLSKVSRINVVLKKDTELDHVNENGYSDVNLDEAVDLFLQFKPFHVYIQDLLVLHSLSDYVWNTTDTTGETLVSREDIDIYVAVQEEDKISYYNQDSDSVESDTDVVDVSRFKGTLEAKCAQIFPMTGTEIGDIKYLSSLGLPLSGYARNENTLWTRSDFSFGDDPAFKEYETVETFVIPEEPSTLYVSCEAFGDVQILMNASQTIYYSEIYPEPRYNFRSVPFDFSFLCDLAQLHDSIIPNKEYSFITNCTINRISREQDTVYINNKAYNKTSIISTPWSLYGIADFKTNTNSNLSYLDILRSLFTKKLILALRYNDVTYTLNHKLHFAIDAKSNAIILNMKAIASVLPVEFDAESVLCDNTELYFLYSCLIPNDNLLVSTGSRDAQVSGSREFLPFNRITYLDNSEIQTEIDSAHLDPVLEYSDSLDALVENTIKTKLFKTPMTVFTRSCLHEEDTGTPHKAISYDPYVCRDTSLWKVYSDPADTKYVGSERLTRTIWSNYFNVPFTNSTTLVPYTDIDVSKDAQMANRASFRWKATVESTPSTHPQFFAASRRPSKEKEAIWTRGSACKLARPYISSSRDSIQGFRDTNALFNRSEDLLDYGVSVLSTYGTEKYKYTLNGIDYTSAHKNPSVVLPNDVVPETEYCATYWPEIKTKIVNNKIVYPNFKTELNVEPQYETPFDFTKRETYYSDGALKPSLYSNNIRTDLKSYSSGLLDDFADLLDIEIDGLLQKQIIYKVSSSKDIEMLLPKINIFVLWREKNTESPMGIGLFPLRNSDDVRPNVQVFKNGIELSYGDYWVIASDPLRIILTEACSIVEGDTFEIIYQVLNDTEEGVFPADPAGVPYDSSNTLETTELTIVPLQFSAADKYKLYNIPFTETPIISWYRMDTAAFINVSVSNGIDLLSPIPKMYKTLAKPNVELKVNGIIREYSTYWKFVVNPVTKAYEILLTQSLTSILMPHDAIQVTYTKLLN